VRRIIDSQKDEITHLDIPDLSKALLMLRQDETSLKLTRNQDKHVINLLPSLDPYMMGYKDRERYLNQGTPRLHFRPRRQRNINHSTQRKSHRNLGFQRAGRQGFSF
jgi:hypothetical protein